MAKSVDFYELLGVSIFASPEEIKAAYIKKMKEYHPDAYQGSKKEAENISAGINAGYEILSDPKQKLVYDQKYGFEEQRQAVLSEKEKQKRKEQKKAKKQDKKTYATEKKQQAEAKRQKEFSQSNEKEDKKIKTHFFSKKLKKDAKVVHPFATTPEQKQMRKERLVLDITIIVLLIIVIALIIFK